MFFLLMTCFPQNMIYQLFSVAYNMNNIYAQPCVGLVFKTDVVLEKQQNMLFHQISLESCCAVQIIFNQFRFEMRQLSPNQADILEQDWGTGQGSAR